MWIRIWVINFLKGGNKSFLSIKFGELENFRDKNLKWNIEENSGIKYIKLKKDIGRRKTKEIKLTAKSNERGNLISIKSIEIIKEKNDTWNKGKCGIISSKTIWNWLKQLN